MLRIALPCLLAALGLLAGPAAAQRQPPPRIGDALVGSRWEAVTLRGAAVEDAARATIDFLPGDHVRGSVACNRFVAPYASRADRITIGPIRVSRLRCPDADFQRRMIDTLHRAERAVMTEEPPALELVGPDGSVSRFVPRPAGR